MKSEGWRKCNTKSRLGTFHVIVMTRVSQTFETQAFLCWKVTGGYFVIFQELRKFCVPASSHMFTTVSGIYALSFSNVLHQLKLCSLESPVNVTFTRKPSKGSTGKTSADSSILSEHVLLFSTFLDLCTKQTLLEFHPLSRLSCSNLPQHWNKPVLSLASVLISLSNGKRQLSLQKQWKSKLNS